MATPFDNMEDWATNARVEGFNNWADDMNVPADARPIAAAAWDAAWRAHTGYTKKKNLKETS